jgi:hypothetical protein
MNPAWRTEPRVFPIALIIAWCLVAVQAQTGSGANAGLQAAVEERDGQHDFDFEFGHWKVHSRGLLPPLRG